jgi:hypothetical protein
MAVCEHEGPRHLIELPDAHGALEKLWMCCACGNVVGMFKRVNIAGCDFISDTHNWINSKGKIISEYING